MLSYSRIPHLSFTLVNCDLKGRAGIVVNHPGYIGILLVFSSFSGILPGFLSLSPKPRLIIVIVL